MESLDLKHSLKLLEKDIILSDNFRKEDIIRQTALQIIKDFNEFAIDITFSGNSENAYHELLDQLIPNIDTILKRDMHQFFNMLYRIDLNEKLIFKTEALFPDMNKAEVISHLIIQRDLKKVLIRNYYKETGSI